MSSTPKAPEVIPMHEVKNCIAYYNSNKGFYANHHPGGILWSNNSSYMNPYWQAATTSLSYRACRP